MKKIVYLSIVVLLFCGLYVHAEELETVQPTAMLVAYADANSVALDVNTTSWATAKNWPTISKKANGLKVMFYANNTASPDNQTFSYQLYVADYGASAQLVAAGTATVGKAQLSNNPISLADLNSGLTDPNTLWVDTLGTITSDWKTTVAPQNDAGADDVASFVFDRQSGRKVWCRIYGRSSATLNVSCIAYGY